MGPKTEKALPPVRPWRRAVQWTVVLALVAIPLAARNAADWPPSRIALGHLPPPTVFPVSGDTWSLSIDGLTLTHPLAFFDAVLASKAVLLSFLASMLLPLLIAVLLGRVFCSWLCPVGFGLELLQRVERRLALAPSRRRWRLRDERYALLAVCLAFSFFFAFPVLSGFDPPHVFGRELMYLATLGSVSASGIGLLLVILLLDALVYSRLWCNCLCPSGGGLALLGAGRLLRIRMDRRKCTRCGICDGVCPYYIEPMRLAQDRLFDWKKCDNCGLCRDHCPEGAITFSCKR